MYKTCTKCRVEKGLGEFSPKKKGKYGVHSYCKCCKAQLQKEHVEGLSEESREEWKKRHRESDKKWWDRLSEDKKKEQKDRRKKWKIINRKRLAESYKKRYHDDVCVRLVDRLRNRIWHAIKGGEKPESVIKALGCTVKELKNHLESQFCSEMSWKNHSLLGWHIDHIRPLCSFDLTDPDQFAEASHYANLRPLWAKDNLKKGGRESSEVK